MKTQQFHYHGRKSELQISTNTRQAFEKHCPAVLEQADSLCMHLFLCQRRLRRLGHVDRMNDGRLTKDVIRMRWPLVPPGRVPSIAFQGRLPERPETHRHQFWKEV